MPPIGLAAASSFTSVSLAARPLVPLHRELLQIGLALRLAPHLVIDDPDHHGMLRRQLAGPVDRRFDDIPVTTTEQGALFRWRVHFDCTIHDEVVAGDHTIVLLRLHAVAHSGVGSLVFHRSVFGKLARPA